MNAPLNKDQQIELMRDAGTRIEAQVSAWVKNSQIRASLKREIGGDRYSLSTLTTKVRRCG